MKPLRSPGNDTARPFIFAACYLILLPGCSLFGYYKHRGPEWAPPGEADQVVFPNSYEKATLLDGPSMMALEVAKNEFMPTGVKAKAHNEELARCLLRLDTYDVSVLKENDSLFFVTFSPELSRCNIETDGFIIFDAGATYAIDGRGRVLAVQ